MTHKTTDCQNEQNANQNNASASMVALHTVSISAGAMNNVTLTSAASLCNLPKPVNQSRPSILQQIAMYKRLQKARG